MTAAASSFPVLAVTGLHAEARIAAGAGVATLPGGGDPMRLASLLQARLAGGACAVISFGIAGGLAPGLRAGTVIVADAVTDGDTVWTSDAEWRARLHRVLPRAQRGLLVGVDGAVSEKADKAVLHVRHGALAADMESHVAARLAARHGVPFMALRVVADPAERSLPRAALVGMRPDGSTDVGAVLRALARRPRELPGLIQTALDARAAFASLKSARRQLCDQFHFGGMADGRRDAVSSGYRESIGEAGLALIEGGEGA